MTLTNPLASNPPQVAAIRATRLYVLIRDAYLAMPQVTMHKLAALEELRRATVPAPTQTPLGPDAPGSGSCDPGVAGAGTPEGGATSAPGAPPPRPHTEPLAPSESTDSAEGRGRSGPGLHRRTTEETAGTPMGSFGAAVPAQLTGVRLVEWLREFMHESSTGMSAPESALALLDVMTDAVPPRHAATSPAARTPDALEWSTDPQALLMDAGGYLAPQVSIAMLNRLTRLHRTSRRFLAAGSRLGLPARAMTGATDGPEDAIADMIGSVLGLRPESARAAAVTLLDDGSLDPTPGIAGGVIFDRLGGFTGPEAFVGTRLARRAPADLIYHLATVECALRLRPGLKPSVSAALAALHEDVCALAAADDVEAARVRAGRRAVELSVLRLGAGERGRIGTIAGHLPRPRGWIEPAHGTA